MFDFISILAALICLAVGGYGLKTRQGSFALNTFCMVVGAVLLAATVATLGNPAP